ncbi:hypothetical protein NMP65_002389 [Salmonella enterica]|nr:hypothetical protein [Salmonella enterica subsp. enterica serovar Arechavaleta]EJL5947501.1 hypothetical protein [Salmonella enterica]
MLKSHSFTSADNYLATLQFRLDDATERNIQSGRSHEEIKDYHQLVWTYPRLTQVSGIAKALVAPQFLVHCLDNAACSDNELPSFCMLPLDGDETLPLICNILLSEYQRLGYLSVGEKIKKKFQVIDHPELQEKLALTLWSNVLAGGDITMSSSGMNTTDDELNKEITHYLSSHEQLYSEADAYVFFSCFGYWNTTP